MIAFWIALGIDLGWFLVPTWLHCGSKLAPSWAKLAPSWPASAACAFMQGAWGCGQGSLWRAWRVWRMKIWRLKVKGTCRFRIGGASSAANVCYFPVPGGLPSGCSASLGGLCWLMLGYFFDFFLMFFLTSVLMAFDIDFRANLASKIDLKSVQNRFKGCSKPIENLILFLIPLWIDFWWILAPTSTLWN